MAGLGGVAEENRSIAKVLLKTPAQIAHMDGKNTEGYV